MARNVFCIVILQLSSIVTSKQQAGGNGSDCDILARALGQRPYQLVFRQIYALSVSQTQSSHSRFRRAEQWTSPCQSCRSTLCPHLLRLYNRPKRPQHRSAANVAAAIPAYRKLGLGPRNAPLSMRFDEQVFLAVCGKQNESLWICGVGHGCSLRSTQCSIAKVLIAEPAPEIVIGSCSPYFMYRRCHCLWHLPT